MIIGEILLQNKPLLKGFDWEHPLEFGQSSAESSAKMTVFLLRRIRSLFTSRGEMEDKKT
jgi:hypothetical protein